jgi:positive regulator of sigma E activity
MQVSGKVVEIYNNNTAKVEIIRNSMCGEHCSGCSGCSLTSSTIIVENSCNAQKNDEVLIITGKNRVLSLSFLTFILPLLSIVVFYKIMMNFALNENIVALLSFLGGIVVFIGITLYFKKLKMPKIERKTNV